MAGELCFCKRFNNNFLGIEQRYETGVGFIFNFFSKNRLTASGKSTATSLQKIPKYDIYKDDLRRCLDECYVKKSVLELTATDAATITNTRERYRRSQY